MNEFRMAFDFDGAKQGDVLHSSGDMKFHTIAGAGMWGWNDLQVLADHGIVTRRKKNQMVPIYDVLFDIDDAPDSDIVWAPGRKGYYAVSIKTSPLWDLAACPGTTAAAFEALASNSTEWQMHVAACRRRIRAIMLAHPTADLFQCCDDLGTATGSFINPETFEAAYLPFLEWFDRECEAMNAASCWHSCGDVRALLPVLRKTHLDVLRLDQAHLCGSDLRRSCEAEQVLWFAPDMATETAESYAHRLMMSRPAWGLYNRKEAETSGNVEEQLALIREAQRIIRETK